MILSNHMIGYEFEFLVREGDAPLSKRTFESFHSELAKQGWKSKIDPGTGGIVGSENNGFFVTSDDGVCTMELNTPPRNTIRECHQQMEQLLSQLQAIYRSLGCSIIGVSAFPGAFDLHRTKCQNFCLDDQCCNKSYIKYFNPQRFPQGHHALYIFAANQVWLDVAHQDVMRQWNVLQALSPVFYALFSNSPLFNNKPIGVLEGRDILWETMLGSSVVGNDSQYFGMTPTPFSTLIEYFDFILLMPFYFDVRGGMGYKLVNPRTTYREFFLAPESEAEFFDGTRFMVRPEKSDFWGLQQRTFPHVRIKYRIKEEVTIDKIINALSARDEERLFACFEQCFLECRAIAAQPQKDISAGPAFLLGLQENILAVETIVQRRPYKFWVDLYTVVQQKGLEAEQEDVHVAELAKNLLEIATEGLRKRGFGEERYLQPLWQRVERKRNPSQELVNIWQQGGLAAVWKARDFV